MAASDTAGTQHSGSVSAEIEIEFRDKNSNGNLEYRVCKYDNGSPSNFLGNDIHVYFEDWVSHGGYAMIDSNVSTSSSSNCTSWENVSGEGNFYDGDGLGGQVRVVSPAYVKQNWNRWCSFNGQPGGSCWYINTSTLTRTCK